MIVNELNLPDSFIAVITAGKLRRVIGSWPLKQNLDYYGNYLETELSEVFEDEVAIASATSSLSEHFVADGYYGDGSKNEEPRAIADITDFTQIIQFGASGDGAPFCFDFRGTIDDPSVIWWDDAYWRRIAPNFDDFIGLFQLEPEIDF
jgi:hypothetical protein